MDWDIWEYTADLKIHLESFQSHRHVRTRWSAEQARSSANPWKTKIYPLTTHAITMACATLALNRWILSVSDPKYLYQSAPFDMGTFWQHTLPKIWPPYFRQYWNTHQQLLFPLSTYYFCSSKQCYRMRGARKCFMIYLVLFRFILVVWTRSLYSAPRKPMQTRQCHPMLVSLFMIPRGEASYSTKKKRENNLQKWNRKKSPSPSVYTLLHHPIALEFSKGKWGE